MAKNKQIEPENETEDILLKKHSEEDMPEIGSLGIGTEDDALLGPDLGTDVIDEVFGEVGEESIPLEEEIVPPEEDGLEDDVFDFSLEDYEN